MNIRKQKDIPVGRKTISYCEARRYCNCSALLHGSAQQFRLIVHYLPRLSTTLAISADLPNSTVYTLDEE